MNLFVILTGLVIGAYLAFSPRLASSSNWKATVTPLASIMGSGFLVSAPLLAGIVGNLAILFMALLLVLAFLVGGAIRFNIRHFEPIETAEHGHAQNIAFLSRIVLVAAYFISVTYYLELMAAFVFKAVGLHSEVAARSLTTAMLVGIGVVGIWRGLKELEAIEKFAVALNLGAIGALIASLAVYNVHLALAGTWALPSLSSGIDLHDIRVLLGLLIVVQGFETSRYLGDEHPAEQRIATMRNAQLISSVIYLVFIALATVLFKSGLGADVTAIIDMTRPVALVLPFLLAVAAIGSQFTAAVADTEGAGGLIEDISERKISSRYAYSLILIITVVMTWSTNVNQIIAYASRAFALFYSLQCIVAWVVAFQLKDSSRRLHRLVFFAFLALMCFLVFAFGIPSG